MYQGNSLNLASSLYFCGVTPPGSGPMCLCRLHTLHQEYLLSTQSKWYSGWSPSEKSNGKLLINGLWGVVKIVHHNIFIIKCTYSEWSDQLGVLLGGNQRWWLLSSYILQYYIMLFLRFRWQIIAVIASQEIYFLHHVIFNNILAQKRSAHQPNQLPLNWTASIWKRQTKIKLPPQS